MLRRLACRLLWHDLEVGQYGAIARCRRCGAAFLARERR